jgi:hypothetical protein
LRWHTLEREPEFQSVDTRMRILTLFARHGSAKYTDALDELRVFYRRRLPSVSHDLLVVDNALAEEHGQEPSEDRVIAGSNRFWEFSAWDEGLAKVGQRVWDYDLVHLVTSAFRTLYTRYIDRFEELMLESIAGRGAALGHIDYYNEPVVVLGNRAQAWIRTSFVFLPPAELATLGSLVCVNRPEELFSGDPEHPFRKDAPLSENYRQYILDWLTGPGTGQGVIWHSRFEVTSETLPHFQAKVLAMLNEQMLAVRLRRQGCALVDATWLATQAARRNLSAALKPIPYWRVQLAQRDTDAPPTATIQSVNAKQ